MPGTMFRRLPGILLRTAPGTQSHSLRLSVADSAPKPPVLSCGRRPALCSESPLGTLLRRPRHPAADGTRHSAPKPPASGCGLRPALRSEAPGTQLQRRPHSAPSPPDTQLRKPPDTPGTQFLSLPSVNSIKCPWAHQLRK